MKRELAQLENNHESTRSKRDGFRSGFTLLEVIVAGSVLFIVASAVVGLSNTIIQGTVSNSDLTIMNRWSSEGLELTQKIRDEKVLKNATDSNGNRLWLDQAVDANAYGWYQLKDVSTGSWQLVPTSLSNKQEISAIDTSSGEALTADQIQAYRLICVESVGAKQFPDDDANIYCNVKNESGEAYTDGDRNVKSDCDTNDLYCAFTKPSLNKSNTTASSTIIPAGNAVRVRSVVVWADKSRYKTSDTSTLMTNWQGYGL